MKKAFFYVSGIIILSIFFSCKKEQIAETNNLSNDEAAEIAAASLSSGNGGSSSQLEDAAKYSETIINDTLSEKTSETYDTTFTVSKDTGRTTFNYSFHYQYGMQYNASTHRFEYFMNYDTEGKFESLHLYSEDNSNGELVLTGLEQNQDYYLINGNVTRTGNQTVKKQDKKSVSATVILTFNNIKIRKSDYLLTEGSGELTIKGKTSEGAEFSFTGTVVYKGDGTVNLVINGQEYSIELASGEIKS